MSCSTLTKATSDDYSYVFNASNQLWMRVQDDPYKMSNINKMFYREGIEKEVKATHYALKLFPRDEQELNELIALNDIHYSYIPFGYEYVPAFLSDSLDTIVEKMSCFFEEERYFYSDIHDTTIKRSMPVLYAAWPINRSLPKGFDYSIEYSVCIPDYLGEYANDHDMNRLNTMMGNRNIVLSGYSLCYE